MEHTLISKKELLRRYGISYGALYRWKRKGLIPEEWFIKKSAVTGQETYFPEALICGRIELILEHKDELGLDELAQKLREKSPCRTLILQTVYGERTYLLREIKEIYYEMENGARKDILENVICLCDDIDVSYEAETPKAEEQEDMVHTETAEYGETPDFMDAPYVAEEPDE